MFGYSEDSSLDFFHGYVGKKNEEGSCVHVARMKMKISLIRLGLGNLHHVLFNLLLSLIVNSLGFELGSQSHHSQWMAQHFHAIDER